MMGPIPLKQISPDRQDRLRAKLQALNKSPCGLCLNEQRSIADRLVFMGTISSAMMFVPLICEVCGCTQFISVRFLDPELHIEIVEEMGYHERHDG